MTTCIVHGDPGSRKTATLVAHYGVPALYAGRTVITNIRGFNSKSRVEEVYGKPLPEGAEIIHVPFTEQGFHQVATYFHWAPAGAVILMDEGQRIYPTRERRLDQYDCNPPRETGYVDPESGVAETIRTVEESFDCHRHMNWDIYISTPNIEKIHKEIRQVAEFGYRQKDLYSISPLLSFLLGDIKRVKHNAENKGNTPGQAILATNHRIDKRVFRVYQSTATGLAKGSETRTSIFAQPKLLFAAFAVGFALYSFGTDYFRYGTILPTGAQIAAYDAAKSAGAAPVAVDTASQKVDQVHSAQAAGDVRPDVRHGRDYSGLAQPLIDRLYSWVGTVSDGRSTRYLIEMAVNDGGYIVVDSKDLRDLGIEVRAKRNFLIVSLGDASRIVETVYRPYVEVARASVSADTAPEFE